MPRSPAKTKPAARRPSTRDDTKRETRAALVQAALELFGEQGLDVPSLDAICDRAGFTRGAFYVHFKTREDILVAVMDHVGALFLTSVFEGLAEDAAPKPRGKARRLHHAARRFVEAVESGAYPLMTTGPAAARPFVRPHQLLDACVRSEVVRERYRDLLERSIGAVAALAGADQAEGELRADVPPDVVATMAHALIIGAQTMAEVGAAPDPQVLAAAFERLLKPT